MLTDVPANTLTDVYRYAKLFLSSCCAGLGMTCVIAVLRWALLQLVYQASTLFLSRLAAAGLCLLVYKVYSNNVLPTNLMEPALTRIDMLLFIVNHMLVLVDYFRNFVIAYCKSHLKKNRTKLACLCVFVAMLLLMPAITIPLPLLFCLAGAAGLCFLVSKIYSSNVLPANLLTQIDILLFIVNHMPVLVDIFRILWRKRFQPAPVTIANDHAPLSDKQRIQHLNRQSEIHEAQTMINELEQHVLELKNDENSYNNQARAIGKTLLYVLLCCISGSVCFGLPTNQVYPASVQVPRQ